MTSSSALARPDPAASLAQFLVFQHRTNRFAAELRLVQEVLATLEQPIAPVPNTEPMLLGLTNLRGEILPVVDFGQFIGAEPVICNTSDSRVLVLENTQVSSEQPIDRQTTIRFGVAVEGVQGVVPIHRSKVELSGNVSSGLARYLQGLYDLDGQLLMLISVSAFANDSRW